MNRRHSSKSLQLCALLAAIVILPLFAFGKEKTKDKSALTPLPIASLNRTTPVDFESEILPMFRNSCLACHNRTTTKGGLILETPQTIAKGSEDGPVVVPGKSAESRLLEVSAHQDKPIMPPRDNKASAPNLKPEQLALLKLWIDQGAKGEVRTVAIKWQPIAKSFTPAYATAITFDGQLAALGRANQLELFDLVVLKPLGGLNDPAVAAPSSGAHRDSIYALAFSPDAQRLASGSFGEIKIWKRQAPAAKSTLAAEPAASITTLAASSDGKWIALAGENQQVQLIDAATGKTAKTIAGHTGPVRALRFSPDNTRLASATDKMIYVWNVADAAKLTELAVKADIKALAWTHGGKRLAAGHADNMIRPYTLSDAAPFTLTAGTDIKGHIGPVTALDTVAPGTQLISGSADGSVRIWNADNGQMMRQLPHGGPVTAVAARADGKMFASAGDAGAKLWDAVKATPVAELKGDLPLTNIANAKDGAQKLAVADVTFQKAVLTKAEAELKAQQDRLKKGIETKATVDKPDPKLPENLKTATDAKTAAAKVLADATAEQKKATDAFDAAEKDRKAAETAAAKPGVPAPELEKLKADLAAKTKTATDAKAAVDKVAATFKDATDKATAADKALKVAELAIKAADIAKSNAANEIELANASIARVQATIKETQALIAAADEKQKKADAELAEAKKVLAAADKPVRAVVFSADNSAVYTAGDDQKIHQWGAETGAAVQVIAAHKSPILALAANPAGVISASADKSAILWDAAPRWTLERTIGSGDANSPISDRVNSLAFSPDGRLLASGSGEPSRGGEIKLWDVASGSLSLDLPTVHSDAVLTLDFSYDGKRLASGAADRFVKITDLTTKKTTSYEGHTHHVLGVSFKADGRTLLSAGADMSVKVWDLISGERKANVVGFVAEVTAAHFIGVTDQAMIAGSEGQFRIINEGGGAVKTITGPPDHAHAAAISADGKVLVTAAQSGTLYVWDAVGAKAITTFAPPNLAPTTQPAATSAPAKK